MSTRGFRFVFAADVVSTFGSLMSRLAIPWLAVLVLGAGPSQMALLAVADVAAGALAALSLGVLVDRWPKRRAMIACDLLRAAALLAIPVLGMVGALSIGWLIAIVAFNGALSVAFELAQSAWIARSTESEHLAQRNSTLAAGAALTEAASFSLTGWIFQRLGGFVAIVVDACTYLASALLLMWVDEPPRAPSSDDAAGPSTVRSALHAFAAEVRDGLRALAGDAVLRAQAIVVALTEFGMSFAATTYMIYVARDVGFPTGTLGLIFALGGIGSLFGSWLAARLAKRFEPRALLVGGLVVWALGSACAPLAAAATSLGIALLAAQQIVGDAGAMVYLITDRTLRQTRAPAEFLARVDAGIRTLGYGATLAGALISGTLAEIFGARALLFASSALIGVAALVAAVLLRGRTALARSQA
jgi:MFS family permease